MNKPLPIMANERTAAALLDMKLAEFLAAVEAGHLPCAREFVPGVKRWPVDDLRRIAMGEAIDGMGDVRW
jgi:hypothetical protein